MFSRIALFFSHLLVMLQFNDFREISKFKSKLGKFEIDSYLILNCFKTLTSHLGVYTKVSLWFCNIMTAFKMTRVLLISVLSVFFLDDAHGGCCNADFWCDGDPR